MNLVQRIFFEARERRVRAWEARRVMEDEQAAREIAELSELQWRALLRLAQRVIDGRVAILSRGVSLPEDGVREALGAIAGVEDFIRAISVLREGGEA